MRRLLVLISTLQLLAPPVASAQTEGRERRRPQPKPAAPPPFRPQVENVLDQEIRRVQAAGDYERAMGLLRRALAARVRRVGSVRPEVADLLRRLAIVYYAKGEFPAAARLFERVLQIRERFPGPRRLHLTGALRDLATVNLDRGSYDPAEALFRRVLELREQETPPDTGEIAAALTDLGALFCEKRDFGRARPLLERALSLLVAAGASDAPALATLHNNLGLLHQAQGDLAEAEKHLSRALSLQEATEGKDSLAVTYPLSNLGLLAHARGDLGRAADLFQRAHAIRERRLDALHPALSTSVTNRAWMALAQKDVPGALDLARRALEIRERSLSLILSSGTERQKLAYLATLRSETDFAVSLHLDFAPKSPEAARLALTTVLRRKGRVLDAVSAELDGLRRRLSPEDRADLEALAQVRAQLAALALRRQRLVGAAEERARHVALAERAQALEARLSERSEEFRAREQPVTVEEVQALLPPEAALAEIVWFRPLRPLAADERERWGPPRYAAAILRAQGTPAWVDLGDAAPIEEGLGRLRRALAQEESAGGGLQSLDFVRRRARHLHRKVFEPLRPLLGDARLLLWAPDGALSLLPLAALVDENQRFLVETLTPAVLTSGRDLLRMRRALKPRQGPVVLVNPAYELGPAAASQPVGAAAMRGRRSSELGTPKFSPLPGTEGEGEALSKLLPASLKLSLDQATEAALKKVQGPAVLHVATHGFFLPDQGTENPLVRSGLALAGANRQESGEDDGILTALEASGLDLSGTKLAVLSACETGVGEVHNGEGLYGLRRALLIAGAESQVLSLWKVSDPATRDLMAAFYAELQAGAGRAEALRRAQLALLASPGWSHPYYWAAFVPSGDFRPLDWKEIAGVPP